MSDEHTFMKDFERALEHRHDINSEYYHSDWTTLAVALWGAKFMAESLAKSAEGCLGSLTSIQIRKRANELR